MDDTQTIVLCAIFAVLGAALYYKWFTSPQNKGRFSARRKWITILVAAVLLPACWFLMNRILGVLHSSWAPWVLIASLAFLDLFGKTPADISPAETASTRRIQIGILIGGAILIAICMIVFRPSRW